MIQGILNLSNKARASLERLNWLPPLLARLVIGQVFIESGWGKLHHLDKVISYFNELGIPYASLQAPFVAATELGAGLLLFLGLLTRLATLPLISIMLIAILTAKSSEIMTYSDLFSISEFLYIVFLFWLLISGPGKASLDRFVFAKALGVRGSKAQD